MMNLAGFRRRSGLRRRGGPGHLRASLEAELDEAGAPLAMYGTHLDVTDLAVAQREAVEAVEANTLFTAILTATPDYTFITDIRTGAVVYGSPGKTILGITTDELEKLGPALIATLVHPGEQQRLLAANRAALELADGEVLQLRYQARHSDGSWHWLSRRVTPFRRDPATGKVIEVLGIVRDIDDEYRTELALRDSEAHFRALTTQVVDYAIIGLDPHGVIQSWNTGADRLKGYTVEQAVGQNFAMFYTAEDRTAGLPRQLLDTARSAGRVESTGWRVRRDATTFWANVVITALHDEDGELSGFVKVTRDLTEQHRLEAAQLEARARIEEAAARSFTDLTRSHAQLAAFADQVGHDLRSPLTSVLGFTEALSEIPTLAADPDASLYLDRVAASADRMKHTLDRFLDYARVSGELARRPVPLAEVMPDILAGLEHLIAGATITWTDTDVTADPRRLRMLLHNLLANALTYRSPDRACTVEIAARNSADRVELTVVDNGCGIPTQRRSELLQPMWVLRKGVVGTGLGLATAARIALVHDGTIHIGDTPGGGTTVTIELPTSPGTVLSARSEPCRWPAGNRWQNAINVRD